MTGVLERFVGFTDKSPAMLEISSITITGKLGGDFGIVILLDI